MAGSGADRGPLRPWLVRILGIVIGETFPAVLAAAQGGDEAPFSALWRDANPALLRYLRVIAPEVAEDVAADSWVHVVRGLAGFRGDEARLAGLAVHHRPPPGHRRRAVPGPAPGRPVAEMPPGGHPAQPGHRRRGAGAAEHVAPRSRWSRTLPPLQAEVILLRVLAGLDNEATAQLLGRSPGAVRVAAHRGLRRLAQLLQARV